MDNSWVKLYRKLGDNKIMLDDKACRIFIWLLIHVDKKTGSLTAGRFQISEQLKINPSSVYHVLKRLEKKYQIVNIKTNNKYTEISLLNWAIYQNIDLSRTQSVNNKRTTKEQQKNTKQDNNTNVLLKNKRMRERDPHTQKEFLNNKDFQDSLKISFPLLDISGEIEKMIDWLAAEGVSKKDYAAFARNWLRKAKPVESGGGVVIVRA